MLIKTLTVIQTFYIILIFMIAFVVGILLFKTIPQVMFIYYDLRIKKNEYIRSKNLTAETYRQFIYSGKYRKLRFIGNEKIFIKIK